MGELQQEWRRIVRLARHDYPRERRIAYGRGEVRTARLGLVVDVVSLAWWCGVWQPLWRLLDRRRYPVAGCACQPRLRKCNPQCGHPACQDPATYCAANSERPSWRMGAGW